ncbi:MAG: 3-deoxy-8-phosphooctulonate synthase, partial [Rhodobacteraceae bacterium]|nr:3-deoxy-8-phosphooctulonate synthase [Paracoccaceae bacterium]
MKHVRVGNVTFGNDLPLIVIAGPCQLEGRDHALDIAGKLHEICADLGLGFVFKASFDKANRTSATGARGPGLEDGLRQLAAV